MRKHKGLKEFPIKTVNPFPIMSFEPRQSKKVSRGIDVVDPDTGQYMHLGTLTPQGTILHDGSTYIKVFKEGQDMLQAISRPSNSLFWWVMTNVKPNGNDIEIKNTKVTADVKSLKGDAFYLAITELISKGFLAKRGNNKYWINGNFAFNGDRRKIK